MPRRAAITFAVAATVAVAGAAFLTAGTAVALLESRVEAKVAQALGAADDWLTLTPDGTVLRLEGSAPDSAAQIATLARIGSVAGGISIDDQTVIGAAEPEAAATPISAGAHSMEILRDEANVTLFGDVPKADIDGGRLVRRFARATPGEVTNMLAPAPGAVDTRWNDAIDLGLAALGAMERVRISVRAGQVSVSGTAPDRETANAIRKSLLDKKPEGVGLLLTIDTPRALISPFVFEAQLEDGDPLEVRACSTETESGLVAILGMIEPTGATASCRLGVGAPSPEWDQAVTESLQALIDLGAGSLDISDADIALVGPQGMAPDDFASVIDTLGETLPTGFSLSGTLPPTPEVNVSDDMPPPARFTALRTEDGAVRLRGDVTDTVLGDTAQTFAEAQFGFETVLNETAPRAGLPDGWSRRIFGGLEALGMLTSGQLEVTEDTLSVAGTTPTLDIKHMVEARLAERLPEGVAVSLEIFEQEALEVEPRLAVPAELCGEQIDLVLSAATISFPPSETEIDETSLPIIDRIAEILRMCPGARFEIAGHTDSQGRESSNLALSQARADAVMSALLQRNVDMVFLYTKGYGETDPIADNDTEIGRARNRRIEFSLIPQSAEDADNPVLQAGVEGADSVGAARLESPTTIVVPAGTDPESVLPPSARAGDADDAEAPEAGAEAEVGAAEDGDAPEVAATDEVVVDEVADEVAEDAAAPADPAGAEDDADSDAPDAPAADDPDLVRPLPRPETLSEDG